MLNLTRNRLVLITYSDGVTRRVEAASDEGLAAKANEYYRCRRGEVTWVAELTESPKETIWNNRFLDYNGRN